MMIGLSVLLGFWKGFARVGIGLASAVLGLVSGLWFYGTAGSAFQPYVSSRGVANFIGFFLILIGFVTAGALLAALASRFLKSAGLSGLDRLAGGAFGFFRGMILAIALVLMLLAFAPNSPPKAVVDSRYAPYVVDAARLLAVIAPRELKDAVQTSYSKVKKVWADALERGIRRLPAEQI
jgi:membrane protein required for colicin V production